MCTGFSVMWSSSRKLLLRKSWRISGPRGQARSETKWPLLSLLKGSSGGLRSGVEEWKGKVRVDSCYVESGSDAGVATLVSVVKDFDCSEAGGGGSFGLLEVFLV